METVNNNVVEKKVNLAFDIEVPESVNKIGGAKVTIKIDASYRASEECLKAEQAFQEKMLYQIFRMAKEVAGEEETDKKRNRRRHFKR